MATRPRKASSSGRVTPKGGSPKASSAKPTTTNRPTRRGTEGEATPVTIGRRPSSAGFLAVVAVMWMAVGLIVFLTLHTGWRLIPAIVALGIGIMFLRGAVSTVVRRERRRTSGE